MKSWAGLNVAHKKVETALGKLTPPEPDDQFEALRSDCMKFHNKLGEYLADKSTVNLEEDGD